VSAPGGPRLEAVIEDLEAGFEAHLRDLVAFASIPSVSTDPAYAPDLRRAADWLRARLERAGARAEILETGGHPAVYAETPVVPGAPTLLVYGHYDVQPPDPLQAWLTPPFSPTVREDRLYARGVSDDKGPMLVAVLVAEAYGRAGGLPVNLKFLLEGEEEVGSRHLGALVRRERERLKADVVLSADGAMWRTDLPSLNVASRGSTSLEFTVRGPGKDLHSGRHGGAVHNPLHAIASLVASLHDSSGRVAVRGFYDRVRELSGPERDAIRAIPFDEAAYPASVGASAAYGEAGYSTLERQWTRPTLELNGLWGGYEGPGGKTVIPSEAHAKVSCRLVPDQDPDEVRALVVAHLRDHLPGGVSLEVSGDKPGARPYAIDPAHPALGVARRVLRDLYGRDPVDVRMGGTVPICEVFRHELGLDTVFFSFSTGDEDFHSPNEFFRLSRFRDGLRAWAMYLDAVGPALGGAS
jgi:acetylornithine deacetylase/succinyl-diaminopimelate desuccinylase-like protein